MNKVQSIYLYICLTLIIMAVAGLFAFKPITAEAEDDTPHTHDDGITFTAWTDPTSLPDVYANDSYYLTTDVTINQTWIPKGNITLCLNGHTIKHSGSDYDINAAISVNTNRVLNIYDCQGKGAVKTSDRNCIHISGYGTANIYGGIFNSNDNTHPAIVVVGTVTIENASVYGPGAVNIQSYGTANIYGGTFETTASEPTIRAAEYASLKITGGTFIRNNGGNIIQNQGTLKMSGGIVTGQSTSTNGAVGIVNSGTSAAAVIENVTIITEGTAADDDTKADKGLRNDNRGTMTVENCNVTSTNRAVWNTGGSTIKISGGTFKGRYGMYNNSGTFDLSGSPTFTGSTADIYLSDDQKITVAGALRNAAPYSVLTETAPTVGDPVEITNSTTTSYNDKTKFTSKNSSYAVRKNSSGQLELAVPETYTITYDKGTGSDITGSVPSGTKTEGTDFTLSSQTFSRTGYTQTGWSTTDGGAKEYDLGGTYTDDADITLYPYWTDGSGDNTGGDNTDPSEGNDAGNITVDSESGENAPAVSIDSDTASRLEEEVYSQLAPDEREAIDNGSYLNVILRVEDAGDTVPVSDMEAAEAVIAGSAHTLGQYLNIDILKFIDGQAAGKITRLNSKISITIEVPENMRSASRAFMIVRIHEGKADTLIDIDSDPNTITILTDKFSTYAIAYQDGQQGGQQDGQQGGRPGGQNNAAGTPGNAGVPSIVPANNSISDSNDKSGDSNSAGEDVSSAAGISAEDELLGDTVPIVIVDMFIPVGIVLVSMMFIIRKRSKASK